MTVHARYARPHRFPLLRVGVAVALLVLGSGCASAPLATAAEPSQQNPMKPRVEVELMVVHATNAHDKVDERLRPVLQHLRFLQFKGFSLLSLDEQHIAVGSAHTFNIVGDRRVTIDVIERDPIQAKLRVRMFNERGMFLDTTIRIHRDKSFMVGGPDHDGGKLLLPITVHY